MDKIAQEKFKIPALDPSLYLVEEDQHKKFKSHLRKSRNTEKLKGQKYMTHQIEEISAEEPKKTSKNLSKSVKNLSISDLSEPSMEQPEVESPKIFFEELQRSIAFSRNVTSKVESPKVLEVPLKNVEEPQERSNLHNLYRITPNKKRVGFNLDTIPDEEEGKSSPAPNILPAVKDYKELRKELSDSDWNISSFEDEEVVDGKFVKH